MTALRRPFDPEAAFVASSEMTVAGTVYRERDPFPWKDLGLTVDVIATFWIAGKVDCLAPAESSPPIEQTPVAPPIVQPAPSQPRPAKHQPRGR